MHPVIFNACIGCGLAMIAAGTWISFGAGISLLVTGASMCAFTLLVFIISMRVRD